MREVISRLHRAFVLPSIWSIWSASIANVTDISSPFQLSFYVTLQSESPNYVAIDSIQLVDCYQGVIPLFTAAGWQ